MAYYSVLILHEKDPDRPRFTEYEPETVYFGEDETMMRVRFFDAVRLAQAAPRAVVVTVWRDLEVLVRVKIEH